MRDATPELTKAGVTVAVVGMGTPAQTADFVRELSLPYPVLSDPDRSAYAAYGNVKMGLRQMANPRGAMAVAGAMKRGNTGGSMVGDPMQLGGVWVISSKGEVLMARPSAYMGDHASVAEIIAAAG